MFDVLELRYFKCFELLKLPLSSLTVLSGMNASGKSSVLQSLMLLHQTMRDHEWSDRLLLNGHVAQVGMVSDVVDQVNSRGRFEIGLSNNEVRCNWVFAGERRDMSADLIQISIDDDTFKPPSRMRWLLPLDEFGEARTLALGIRNLTYITAERDGPREVYPLMDEHAVRVVGSRGEYAVSTLHQARDDHIDAKLVLTNVAPTLSRQVEARLDTFFPGCKLELRQIAGTTAVTLGIRISEATGFLRPIHCGFGITQVLPIIVAVLSARTSSGSGSPLLLIENPEVHLHPAGQALMGGFLAEAAHSGVQIIVETHSDHVLNGVRRAVKSGRASADEVAIHFLRDRFLYETQILSPTLDSSGNIDVWPEGFFDQFDKDLNYFVGWGE